MDNTIRFQRFFGQKPGSEIDGLCAAIDRYITISESDRASDGYSSNLEGTLFHIAKLTLLLSKLTGDLEEKTTPPLRIVSTTLPLYVLHPVPLQAGDATPAGWRTQRVCDACLMACVEYESLIFLRIYRYLCEYMAKFMYAVEPLTSTGAEIRQYRSSSVAQQSHVTTESACKSALRVCQIALHVLDKHPDVRCPAQGTGDSATGSPLSTFLLYVKSITDTLISLSVATLAFSGFHLSTEVYIEPILNYPKLSRFRVLRHDKLRDLSGRLRGARECHATECTDADVEERLRVVRADIELAGIQANVAISIQTHNSIIYEDQLERIRDLRSATPRAEIFLETLKRIEDPAHSRRRLGMDPIITTLPSSIGFEFSDGDIERIIKDAETEARLDFRDPL